MPIDLERGQFMRCTPINNHLFSATIDWGRVFELVPDPRTAENPRALAYASFNDRAQAELRNDVQRMIRGTQKGKNAKSYADYIARSIRGLLGNGWSTPPIAIWFPQKLEQQSVQGPFGMDYAAVIPYGAKGVAVDAETQHLAHLIIAENPEAYGLTLEQINERKVICEIYHGIDLKEARQIFHDRNLLGVLPTKNIALNSDSRDVATQIAFAIMEEVIIQHPRTKLDSRLQTVVGVNKRQLSGKDIEWFTLSGLRSFVATTLFGRAGFETTSQPVYDNVLPTRADGHQITEEEARVEVVTLARALFTRFMPQFTRRAHTVIGAPAVLAAIGAVGHRSMTWSREPRRSVDEFIGLLSTVNWSRDAKTRDGAMTWDGIAGKATASGKLSLVGGVKDNGSKTATALEDPNVEPYHRIRTAA